MLFIVRMENKATGEKETMTLNLPFNSSIEVEKFKFSIRLHMTHKNRLQWKSKDCSYTYAPYTEQEDLESEAWVHNKTVEEIIKIRELLKDEDFLL